MDTMASRWVEGALGMCRVLPWAFDAGNPRKGGAFSLIDERKWDNSPEEGGRHDARPDVTDEIAAYRLASLPFPGVFGVFFELDRPTKISREQTDLRSAGKIQRAQRSRPSSADI